jgi:hypothetical protein
MKRLRIQNILFVTGLYLIERYNVNNDFVCVSHTTSVRKER